MKDIANILISCRMSDTEHDNKQNEDLQGGGEDKGKEFIKLKVVVQDNSEMLYTRNSMPYFLWILLCFHEILLKSSSGHQYSQWLIVKTILL